LCNACGCETSFSSLSRFRFTDVYILVRWAKREKKRNDSS
jgi:rRNA maturation protein Nop10